MHPDDDAPRLTAPWSRSDRLSARVLAQPLQQFLATEAASGIVLLVAAVTAMVWANSPWASSYTQLWSTEITIGTASLNLTESLQHWVNDLAMALFFFVAGLEIKRELVHGDLRSVRTATLPIACAVGGMVVPATIFLAINAGGAGAGGWGIPMATDIAFAIGVLALLGRRAPPSLKVFLLTLAIVDDIGAIVVIALFYSGGVHLGWLLGAAVTALLVVGLRRLGVQSLVPYVIMAGVLWLATFESGVHATIAGVVLGLLTPARPLQHPDAVQRAALERLEVTHLKDQVDEEQDETSLLDAAAVTVQGVSPLARLEHVLHPWSAFVVLPLFALANAGVPVGGDGITTVLGEPVSLGVLAGLVVGKPLGILAAAVLVVRLGRADLPARAGWSELAGVGMLAGIGFTVSLFVTNLAFTGTTADQARLAILVASAVAGLAGAAFLAARSVPPGAEVAAAPGPGPSAGTS